MELPNACGLPDFPVGESRWQFPATSPLYYGLQMIDATQAGCSRLTEMLADYPDNVAVRVAFRNLRMKTSADTRQPGDFVIEHNGRTVLLLDEQAQNRLRNRTLDVRQSPDGPKLRFRSNPKEHAFKRSAQENRRARRRGNFST